MKAGRATAAAAAAGTTGEPATSGRRASTNASLLEARELRFAYAANLPEVVCGASLSLRRGTLAALIGANGSGKSSLIRLLGGLVAPTRGEVFFDGVPLRSLEPRGRARRIAYVPQASASIFPLTALEVVLMGRSPYTTRFRFENEHDLAVAHAALAAIDAEHLAARSVTELSGGERQLVALARALAQEPECLLLDEPSAALDLKHRAGLIRHLRRLCDERGITALMVTHDLQLLDPAFDQVYAMRCGKVAAAGPPAEVLRDAVLAEVYADAHVRARQAFGRTFVWSE
ncbi:MAG: ABC transporter ATP-binding protein [Pyrinomonadaceae bacterium]